MQQQIHPINRPVQARVNIPGSKSITNRALLLAALSDGVCELSDILLSDDTYAFIEALKQLGVVVQLDESTNSCIVGGCGGTFPKHEANIWCQQAGTVGRFLLAACANTAGKIFFNGSEQLRERPIAELIRVLKMQGAEFDPPNAKKMPFTLIGADRLAGGEIEMDGSESGQFVSALLMSAPFAKTPMVIEVSQLGSKAFVDMTCSVMGSFGVLVKRLHQNKFLVPVPQRYTARDYTIEPDLATASYFFAAAAITADQVTIQPLDTKRSMQGDIKFLSVLEKMGCRMVENANGLTVKGPTELNGVSVDMRDFSDTFMTLAAIAPFAKSPTTITNIGHTRLQESNRISVMREELMKLDIDVDEGPDWIKIYPGEPTGAAINPHQDHRIAMSFAIMGLRVPGMIIQDAECVSKTCPNFFTMLEALY